MRWIFSVVFFVLVLGAVAAVMLLPGPGTAVAPSTQSASSTMSASSDSLDDLLQVAAPIANTTIGSPLTISGQARGSWYFEAVFPIELKDSGGSVIAQAQGRANPPAGGDWTTSDYVPFIATLAFPAQPSGSHGMIVLMNDNPSGDPSKQKELDIPITFR